MIADPQITLFPAWAHAEMVSLRAAVASQRERAAIMEEFQYNAHMMAFEIQRLRGMIEKIEADL